MWVGGAKKTQRIGKLKTGKKKGAESNRESYLGTQNRCAWEQAVSA